MGLRIPDYTYGRSTNNGTAGSSSYFWTPPPLSACFVYDDNTTVWPVFDSTKVEATTYWITPELVKIFNYLLTLFPEEFLKKMEQIEKALSDGTTDFELYNLIMPEEKEEEEEEKEVIFKELLEW